MYNEKIEGNVNIKWKEGGFMNTKYWIINITIITAILVFVQIWKKYIFDKLSISLQNQKFDIYFETLDSLPCKWFFPLFNRLYMRLNGYMILHNKQKINETADALLNIRLSKKQAAETYLKCFYYYINEEDKEYSEKVLKKINDIGEKDISKQCNQLYDIFIKKESGHIESMEEQLNLCGDDYTKQMLHYLIGLQYGYQNNIKKQEEHFSFASETMKNFIRS